jgi:Tc5 transposase DNA-binding domain
MARDYGVDRTTLWRRFCGKTASRAEKSSEYHQRLNNTQEDTLLRYIDSLSDRFIPPTPQIVRNLADEIIKGPVGKNWTGQFLKRHSSRISSVHLRYLNRSRVSAESPSVFEHFYALVLLFLKFLRSPANFVCS